MVSFLVHVNIFWAVCSFSLSQNDRHLRQKFQEVDCLHSGGWPLTAFTGNHPCLPLFSIQATLLIIHSSFSLKLDRFRITFLILQKRNITYFLPLFKASTNKGFFRDEKKYMEPFIVIGPVLIGGGIMTVLFSLEVTCSATFLQVY